jgi:hypothetical protein
MFQFFKQLFADPIQRQQLIDLIDENEDLRKQIITLNCQIIRLKKEHENIKNHNNKAITNSFHSQK